MKYFMLSVLIFSFSAISAENKGRSRFPNPPSIGDLNAISSERGNSSKEDGGARLSQREAEAQDLRGEDTPVRDEDTPARRGEDTHARGENTPARRGEDTHARGENTHARGMRVEYADPPSPTAEQAMKESAEAEGRPAESPPAEQPVTERPGLQDSSSMFLEKTHIGQAVMEGDREKYQTALAELKKVFGVNINNLLSKETSDGQTLSMLMITPAKNKEYFAMELGHLLTLSVLSNISAGTNNWYDPRQNELILEKAKSVNNTFAIQVLEDFNKLIEEMTRYHSKKMTSERTASERMATEEREELLKLVAEALTVAQSSKYNRSMGLSGILRFIAGSALIFGTTGYVWAVDPLLLDKWAEIAATHSRGILTTQSAYYSLLAVIGGGGLVAMGNGYDRCKKAFQKSKILNNIRDHMNHVSIRGRRNSGVL